MKTITIRATKTKIISMIEIDNENTTKTNTTRDNVYTISINKYIEHSPSKTTTVSIWEKRNKHVSARHRGEDKNLLLQERSLGWLCWIIKGQDKAENSQYEFSQPCVKLRVNKTVVV